MSYMLPNKEHTSISRFDSGQSNVDECDDLYGQFVVIDVFEEKKESGDLCYPFEESAQPTNPYVGLPFDLTQQKYGPKQFGGKQDDYVLVKTQSENTERDELIFVLELE
mmetsp:Transcript_28639/g.37529  ORF Transcript_28639/g.37529 Transcript_28639/m.37529 type:complete len:109 (-) Transcript_28639:381-707(-)|eukprot:CAMPEP_0117755762 /NCGR_PEP_ID=MMETSP0947-20121206/13646_1 /TAXON_ID=44440 /ORGANISM="Chattonella subsalsa, Strain CCMP2191" /LENGTH=108 /DNA_ID=CAMNT_0005575161 /DNA_START=112 /DNA_END=438 /DNA_ORIENTATION=+